MRFSLPVLALVALAACTDKDGTTPVDGSTTTDTDPPPGTTLIDTAWPAGDLGNLHIAHHVNTGRTEALAMFLDSSAGYLNMAQCTIREIVGMGGPDIPCITGLPNDDDAFDDVDTDQAVDPDVVNSRFLGFEITYGPHVLPYYEDARTGLGFYGADVTQEELVEGPIGAEWAGQWEKRKSKDDLVVSPPIELLNPQPGSNVFVTNGQMLPVEWVPTGQGEVTLAVSTRFTLYRLFHVKDDGYFEVDLDALGLTGDLEELTFSLTRWDEAEIEWTGHVVQMLATSDVFFTADFANVGARDPIYVVDGCAEAGGMAPLVSGQYWGSLDGYDKNLNPTAWDSCLRLTGNYYSGGAGRDGLVKVELPPKSILNLEYTHFSESGSVYLVTNCSNVNTCVAGMDADMSPGAPEVLSEFNASEDPRTYYLVLDSTADDEDSSEVFTLDATIETLLDPEMYDLCADASIATPTLATGGYYEEFVAYTGDLNPGAGGCTGSSLAGPEAMMPFVLNPGETITATVSMDGGNVGLYILGGCDVFSCVAGSDTELLSGTEVLAYTNTGSAAQNLELVVDSTTGLRPFVLGVTFQ